MKREQDNLQDTSREGMLATSVPESAIGQVHQPSWRTEPEIGEARQEQLIEVSFIATFTQRFFGR